MTSFALFQRIGPVYLWWSEWSERAVVGPAQGAWGGDDLFRCDADDFQGDADEAEIHAASHGFYVRSWSGAAHLAAKAKAKR